MDEEVFIPITMFLTLGGVIWAVSYFRFKARQEIQVTMRSVIQSGQEISADLLSEMTAAMHPKRNDLRRGMVFVAVALAFMVLGFVVDDDEAQSIITGLAAFPLFVGIAYLVLWRFNREQK